MQYGNMIQGTFVSRPNRFVARVLVDGEEVVCHVKNTGRCRELLIPGTRVWLKREENLARKTPYSLIAVEKEGRLVNLDSQAPNKAAFEWVARTMKPELLLRERTYGNSRFDLYFEYNGKRCFMEVKGVTLEENGVALFPDAPTGRGVKHIYELADCVKSGYEAYLLFVIQMKGVHEFRPNDRTQPEFGEALRMARAAGVKILAVDCVVTEHSMEIDEKIAIELDETM